MRKICLKKLEGKSIKNIYLLDVIKGGDDDDDGNADKKRIKIPNSKDNPDEVTSDE